jgi:signal transduction histidine kinase
LSTLLEGAVNQAYDLSLGLWPVDTGIAKLATSLENMCRRSGWAGGFEVAFYSTLTACAHQSPEQTKQLYRIAQEALANVVKHARADHVHVSIGCSPQGGIRLTVEDDGVGRAATEASKNGAGLGMRIMTHRAVIIGGTLSIADRAGGGTIIACTVPCAGTKNDVDCRVGKEPSHA